MQYYNLPISMEILLSMHLLLSLSLALLQIDLSSCIECIPHHSYLTIHKNSPFNTIIYAYFQVVLLHSHKHESDHMTRE